MVWSFEEQKYVSKKEYDSKKNVNEAIEPEKDKKPLPVLIGVLALFLVMYVGYMFYNYASDVPFQNGQMVSQFGISNNAKDPYTYRVTAPNNKNVFVYIQTMDGKRHMSFLVEKGKTFVLHLPKGVYKVYFASGKNWKGHDDLFGSFTRYYQDTRYLNTGVSDSLTMVFGTDNYTLQEISKEEFFNIYDKRSF
jgi:hypothetical protein